MSKFFPVLYTQNGQVIKAPSQREQTMHVLHTVQNKTQNKRFTGVY